MRRRLSSALAALVLLTGCDSPKAVPASSAAITADGYTAEEIYLYFSEIAFQSEYGGWRGQICKWTDELVCFIEGDLAGGEMVVLTDLALRLNSIPGFPGVRMTADRGEANFIISFVMQNELQEIFGPEAEDSSGMSRFYWSKKTGEIVQAQTGIASNIPQKNDKSSVICEEFLQAMGLSSDSYLHPESVFYQGHNASARPAAIDWALLELLYSEELTPGMDAEAALAAVRTLLGLDTPSTYEETTEYE